MFVGRKRELATLENCYRRNGYECVILYGRRRVGKTTLIRQFCQGKKTVFFTAMNTIAELNLQDFSRCIYAAQGGSSVAPIYPDFHAALDAVTDLTRSEKLILVIDEYPYLAKSYPAISSELQIVIDHHWSSLSIMVILCGSSLSFMARQVLGEQSPLFGRRTAQIRLAPLSLFEAREFFPAMNREDVAVLYGLTGGIPMYLARMDACASLETNITQNFLNTSAYFFEEPNNLLLQELRDPATYNAILQAIAEGYSRLHQIATRANLTSSAAAIALQNLIELDLVERQTPFGDKNSRKSLYRLKDSMFVFWYRFVAPHYSQIQNDQGAIVYRQIASQISMFMGAIFETICQQWLWRVNGTPALPICFSTLGRFWGTDPRTKSQAEIDIVAGNADHELLFCECKWHNDDVEAKVLDIVVQRSELLPAEKKYYCLFSKRGFTAGCQSKAQELPFVQLISYADMLGES